MKENIRFRSLYIFVCLCFSVLINSSFQNPSKKKIIFIAGACSHGVGAHEHKAGCWLLAGQLNKYMGDRVEAIVYELWPKDTMVLEDAATIVMYMDGAGNHLALKHLDHLNKLMQQGIGIVNIHFAVEIPTKMAGSEFKRWIGGYFETFYSVNPTWVAQYKVIPKHTITNGVSPFEIRDEWYYNMRFADNMEGVTPILTSIPPACTLTRGDGSREGNEFVRKMAGQPQHMAWAFQRKDGGRGFGFTGGHSHKNWANKDFRKIVLNGIIWTAKLRVPKQGVPTPELSAEEMQANLDTKPCK